MGGNAFPGLNTVRLDAPEFYHFSKDLFAKLIRKIPPNFAYIPCYFRKESFGDLDILYNQLSPDEIHAALGYPPIFRNGPCTSFAIQLDSIPNETRYFQVDFIRVALVEMECALGYFAYNDLGNLIGRIAHRAGFKLGHRGLSYIIREEGNSNHVLKEIFLTHDWKTCLEFLGYDYEVWKKGFETLEDVFRFVVQNPLANQHLFRLDQTNHAARIRDRKRKTYNEFLVWVGDEKNGVPREEIIPKYKLRSLFFMKACVKFPYFKNEYHKTQQDILDHRLFKSKFNGSIVSEITGLSGKELGAFLKSFISDYIEKIHKLNKVKWAKETHHDEIKSQILFWFCCKNIIDYKVQE